MGPVIGCLARASQILMVALALLAAGPVSAQQSSSLRMGTPGGTSSMLMTGGGTSGEKGGEEAGTISISDVSLRTGLLADDVKQVEQYIRYWGDKLVQAGTPQEVLTARGRLMRCYGTYNNWNYQSVYAEQAAKILSPYLTSADTLKQVNIGLVLSHMEQVSVQPALETMITSPNPALRLFGWHGYRRIEPLVLAQGKEFVATMLGSLARAAKEEDSGFVMSAVFRMFYLDQDRPTFILPSVYEKTRAELFDILKNSWPRVCKLVLDGDVRMIQATGEALKTLRRIAVSAGTQKDVPQAVVQMLLDMMWCAAKTFADAENGSPRQLAAEALLRDCEGAMNTVTQLHKVPVSSELAKSGEGRSLAVEIAVHTWVRELEKAGWQVSEPKAPEGAGLPQQPAAAPQSEPAE